MASKIKSITVLMCNERNDVWAGLEKTPSLEKSLKCPLALWKQGEVENVVFFWSRYTHTHWLLLIIQARAKASYDNSVFYPSTSIFSSHLIHHFFYQLPWSALQGESCRGCGREPSIIHVLFSGHKDRGARVDPTLSSDVSAR